MKSPVTRGTVSTGPRTQREQLAAFLRKRSIARLAEIWRDGRRLQSGARSARAMKRNAERARAAPGGRDQEGLHPYGKSTVFRELMGNIGSGTTMLHVVRPLSLDADYIVLFLKSPHVIETGILRMTGTTGQKRVPPKYSTSSPFPLPPLSEQHRIAAKVDELMALCDRLETTLTAADTTRQRLLEALLNEALSPEEERKDAT